MLNKKIIMAALLIVGISLFFIFDQTKRTTYAEVITQITDDDETIISLIIADFDTHQEVLTEDESFIEKVVSTPSEMELKAENNNYNVVYYIVFRTDKGNKYDISLGEEGMIIHHAADSNITGRYEIVRDNDLYRLIESEELEWGNL